MYYTTGSVTVRFTNATQCFQMQCSRHALDQSPVLKDALEMCGDGVLHLWNPRVSASAVRVVLTAMSRGAEAGAAAEAANAANAAANPQAVPEEVPEPDQDVPPVPHKDEEYCTAYHAVYRAADAAGDVDMVECIHALHWLDLLHEHYESLYCRNANIDTFEYMAVVKFVEDTATDGVSSPAYEFAHDVFSIQPIDPVPYLVSKLPSCFQEFLPSYS